MQEKASVEANKQRKEYVPAFLALSIVISWIFWAPLLASAARLIQYRLEMTGDIAGFVLYIIAMTGMWIAAIITIAPARGIEGIKERFAVLGSWKRNLHWYPVAVLVPAIVELIAPALFSIASGETPALDIAALDWLHLIVLLILGIHVAVVLMLAGAGYLSPMVEKRWGHLQGSLISTGFTLVWMLPMVGLIVLQNPGHSIIAYSIGTLPLVLALFWLYYTARIG